MQVVYVGLVVALVLLAGQGWLWLRLRNEVVAMLAELSEQVAQVRLVVARLQEMHRAPASANGLVTPDDEGQRRAEADYARTFWN